MKCESVRCGLTTLLLIFLLNVLILVTDMLKSVEGAAVMVVDYSTHDAMTKIHKFTPKLNIHDTNRVNVAIDHYESYIDFEELMRRTQAGNSSFNEPGGISLSELTKYR